MSVALNERGQKLNTISPKIANFLLGMDSTAFCYFMTEICILLFFFVLASKFAKLLIMYKILSPLSKCRGLGDKVTNRIQREFDSNVAIATFEISLASKFAAKKTNLFKQRRAVTSRRQYKIPSLCAVGTASMVYIGLGLEILRATNTLFLCFFGVKPLFFAELLMADMLIGYLQTESKGYFCLITVYSHKNLFRAYAATPKTQTLSNLFFVSLVSSW
jgi:hypothetical protein